MVATAVGTYATLAGAKRRVFEADEENTTNDVLLQELCDDVNSWIESRTQRILAPIPPFASSLVGSVSAGSTSLHLASVTGLAVGNDLLIGLVSGTHESTSILQIGPSPFAPYATWEEETTYAIGAHVTPPTANGHVYSNTGSAGDSGASAPVFPTNGGTVADGANIVWTDLGLDYFPVALQPPLLNAYPNATVCQTIYVQDGFDALENGRLLVVARGMIQVAVVETSPYTGGPWAVVSQTDFFLRPSGPDLDPGWPYTELWMTDIPVGTAYPVFYPGFGNVRLIGPGPCVGLALVPFMGWPATPDDVSKIAYNVVLTTYRGRTTGGGDITTINIDGSRSYENALSYSDRMTLDRYRAKSVLAI